MTETTVCTDIRMSEKEFSVILGRIKYGISEARREHQLSDNVGLLVRLEVFSEADMKEANSITVKITDIEGCEVYSGPLYN